MATVISAERNQAPGFAANQALTVVPLVIGCICSVIFLSVALRGITTLAPTSNAEGNQFHGTLRVHAGQPLYLNFHEFPAVVTPYTPLYYVITGLASRAPALDLLQSLAFTRSVSFLATGGIVGMVFVLARETGASRLARAPAAVSERADEMASAGAECGGRVLSAAGDARAVLAVCAGWTAISDLMSPERSEFAVIRARYHLAVDHPSGHPAPTHLNSRVVLEALP
jgi:hypothetical protein